MKEDNGKNVKEKSVSGRHVFKFKEINKKR
jgi:hypothetical protein